MVILCIKIFIEINLKKKKKIEVIIRTQYLYNIRVYSAKISDWIMNFKFVKLSDMSFYLFIRVYIVNNITFF